jgi:hypothetical protein
MPVPLFAYKPERCPYGHSLAPGMPQKISWMPCICEPAREAERQSRGMGHLTLWCGTCSAEDLAALADAARSAATAKSAGFGGWPPSLSTVTVTS